MARRKFSLCAFAVLAVATLVATDAQAQQGNGVVVDANGVLRTKVFQDPTGQLMRQRMAAARAALDPDLLRPSKTRYVSLTRLEAVVGPAAGHRPGTDGRHALPGRLDADPQRVRVPGQRRRRDRRTGRGLRAQRRRTHRRHPHGPGRAGVAGPGGGPAGLPADGQADAGHGRVDRSHQGRPGPDAAVPDRHPAAASRRRTPSGSPWD